MNFSLDDRQRSLRRYLAMGLDGHTEYDLQLARVQIRDDQRPAGVVAPSTPAVPVGRPPTSIGDGHVPASVQHQQTFSVVLYPEFGDHEDVREVAHRVREVAQRLEDTMAVGLVDAGTGASVSPPERIPVWDYAGVPVKGAGRGTVPDDPYGWLTLEDRPVSILQDPLDDRRWSVIGTLRCSWWSAPRVEGAPVLAGMPSTWDDPELP